MLPPYSAKVSGLCSEQLHLLASHCHIEKRLKKKISPPNPAARIAFALWPWREMMVVRPGAPATCLRNLLGKTSASLGSPASSASSEIRSATCLLSMLHIWADTRRETLCTLCPHAISFRFPAQTCCSGRSLPRADRGSACWKREVEVAGDAEWLWGLTGPAHCTQTAGRQLQEQLDDKMWTEAGATPTKLPNWELRKGQLHSSGQSPVSSRARGCCALYRHRSGPVGALCAHWGLCSETRGQGSREVQGSLGMKGGSGWLGGCCGWLGGCCGWTGGGEGWRSVAGGTEIAMDEHVPSRSLGVKKHCGWHGSPCGWRSARRLLWEKRHRWQGDCYVRPGHRGVPQTGTRFQYWN